MHPILFQFGTFRIYAYGFFIVLGFVTAVVLAALKIRKSNIGVSFENIVDLFFYTVLSAFIGSRLLFVLINFDLYRQDPVRDIQNMGRRAGLLWRACLGRYGCLLLYEMAPVAHLEIG